MCPCYCWSSKARPAAIASPAQINCTCCTEPTRESNVARENVVPIGDAGSNGYYSLAGCLCQAGFRAHHARAVCSQLAHQGCICHHRDHARDWATLAVEPVTGCFFSSGCTLSGAAAHTDSPGLHSLAANTSRTLSIVPKSCAALSRLSLAHQSGSTSTREIDWVVQRVKPVKMGRDDQPFETWLNATLLKVHDGVGFKPYS